MRIKVPSFIALSCALAVWAANAVCMGQSLYYLDFDPDETGLVYPYSSVEKDLILDGLHMMYGAFPHMMFTLDEPTVPHSTVNFNSTAIGTSTGIDFRNVADIDTSSVNALMGFDFLGETSPAPADVVKASVNLAGHEIGHLEGLRHHDSYTPIGSGMPSSVVADYFPDYPGPPSAPSTFTDVMSLTASIPGGFTLGQLTGDLIIGQRSAMKLAYNADPSFFSEGTFGPHGSLPTAAPLPLKTIGLPNVTMPGDPFHGMPLLMDTTAVIGSIGSLGESDYYSFFAHEGDIVQIELLSEIISSRHDEFDVKLLIHDPDETDPDAPGLYYGAFDNADERESTDSLMIDLPILATKDYVIEVVAQSVHDPVGDYELYVAVFRLAPIPEPSSLALALIGLAGLARHVRRR